MYTRTASNHDPTFKRSETIDSDHTRRDTRAGLESIQKQLRRHITRIRPRRTPASRGIIKLVTDAA